MTIKKVFDGMYSDRKCVWSPVIEKRGTCDIEGKSRGSRLERCGRGSFAHGNLCAQAGSMGLSHILLKVIKAKK
jgi:hypothetical protein